MSAPRTYTISEMAEEFGVTLRTLRFYEFRRLISPARNGVHRIYSEADRAAMAKIRVWTGHGFTLTEIHTALTTGKLPDIAAQIAHLRRKRDDLDKAIAELSEVAA